MIEQKTASSIQNNQGQVQAGFVLQVQDLSIRSRKGEKQVSAISFQIEPRELVILTGPNRLALAVLLTTIAGSGRQYEGKIRVDGLDLYSNLKAFVPRIGFVPAECGLPGSFTVNEVLRYEARLRLPGSYRQGDLLERVDEVLVEMGLAIVAHQPVERLSNYQRCLVSIGIEILNKPGLLLVAPFNETLEPFEQVQITARLHALAQKGYTVLQATQVSKAMMLADRMILLAPDGSLAWFGPLDEALEYFYSIAEDKKGLNGSFGFDEILAMLNQEDMAGAKAWGERYKNHPAYQKYVEDVLQNRLPDIQLQDRPLTRFRGAAKEKLPPPIIKSASGLSRFILLAGRGARRLARERSILVMALAVPLVGLIDFLLTSPSMSDPLLGDPGQTPVALGLVVFISMLLSGLLFQNEILKERNLYRRENRTVSLGLPYILSKIWLVALLAIYQGLIWGILHYLASGMMGGVGVIPLYWVTLTLVSLIGGVLGLMASTLGNAPQVVSALVLLLVVPQLVLSGSLIPLSQLNPPARTVAALNPSRYAFEAMLTASGYGRDIATDTCWQMPESQRVQLTEVQKQNCTCLGENIYSRCNFPGIHKFFTFIIEQPRPAQPTPDAQMNSLPAQPLLQQGETLEQYAVAVDNYTQQLSQYQGATGNYLGSLRQYLVNLENWQRARSLVIGNAEGLIYQANQRYGEAFRANLVGHWLTLLGLSIGLVVLLAILQMRKGVTRV